MGSTDTVALVISLVALLITSIQAIQQYAATAYGYRNCSPRTMGSWAKHTKRRFIWSEIRYEITFAVPKLSFTPIQVGYFLESKPTDEETLMDSGQPGLLTRFQPNQRPTTEKQETESRPGREIETKKYNLLPMSTANLPSFPRPGQYFSPSDSPWFLDSKGTVLEGKCSWISLLQDTSFAEMRVTVGQKQGSLDFLPEGVSKPLAQMDRTSFLTLMTLFRVRWRGEYLQTGTGEVCEVSLRNIQNFGDVYYYRTLLPDGIHLSNSLAKFYVPTIKARDAMFNRFNLGFAVLLTDSLPSLAKSLQTIDENISIQSEPIDALGGAGFSSRDRWITFGIGDVIACWATPSMPKQVAPQGDSFFSIFSAPSLFSFSGLLQLDQIIIPNEGASFPPGFIPTDPEPTQLRAWIQAYLKLVTETEHIDESAITKQLELVAQQSEITWSQAKASLPLIRGLDNHLHFLLRLHGPARKRFKREFAHLQIEAVYERSLRPADGYIQMKERLPLDLLQVKEDSKLPEMIIANRILRGLLWLIHNGNWPNGEDRSGECSLSSKCLRDGSTVYIA